jgi:hypothetical protein
VKDDLAQIQGDKIINRDCLDALRLMSDESVDSLVTDPPAGISFMGKDWDSDKGGRKEWITWMSQVMSECLRVLKPGAHGLIWALPRTSHWTATALEDAGFEIRDVVTHLFGSGFPKSLDVSKAMDKAAGLQRQRIPGGQGGTNTVLGARKPGEAISGEAISGEAKEWSGWGTALKPASEHWILVRRPLSEKTVAKNVERWGTGAINIDASRVESIRPAAKFSAPDIRGNQFNSERDKRHEIAQPENLGRFPANLILSHSPHCSDSQCDIECAIVRLDEQSGTLKSGDHKGFSRSNRAGFSGPMSEISTFKRSGDSGGASRFFYVAKPSKREKNAGLEGMEKRTSAIGNATGRSFSESDPYAVRLNENHHPTVKPVQLMRYLITMITPPGGLVLDPFTGSGTTGVAAVQAGFQFQGIEQDSAFAEIATKRIEAVCFAPEAFK